MRHFLVQRFRFFYWAVRCLLILTGTKAASAGEGMTELKRRSVTADPIGFRAVTCPLRVSAGSGTPAGHRGISRPHSGADSR
jgi:hypothetical protein